MSIADDDFEYWWEYEAEEEYEQPAYFVDDDGECWVDVSLTAGETIEILELLIKENNSLIRGAEES